MLKLRSLLLLKNNGAALTSALTSHRSLADAAPKKEAVAKPFNNVTVIGSGLMGSGIAQVTAEAGYQVTLVDQSDKILGKAQEAIKTSLARSSKKKFEKQADAAALAEKHIAGVLGRIKLSTSIESAAEKADLVIEAIVENIGVKHELFKKLDKLAPRNALFASNTSSLPIAEIAQVTVRKDKFGGLHFFNPVPVMKLLEVIKTNETSDSTHETLLTFGKSIGKVTVTCKDTPGFIVNRLLIPIMIQAAHMAERGDASPRDIDTAMKLGAG